MVRILLEKYNLPPSLPPNKSLIKIQDSKTQIVKGVGTEPKPGPDRIVKPVKS